jgi:hypothetical protein
MRPAVVVATLIAVFATAAVGHAQRPAVSVPLDSGRLVRLRLDDGTAVRGRLLRPFAADSTEIRFCRYPAPPCTRPDAPGAAVLAAARIAAVEVQRGTGLWRGVAIGAGIGALLGGFTGWLHNGLCDHPGCGTALPFWVAAGGVSGGLWGALFGSQSVVWRPAPRADPP